jgi:hypothetical protein
MYHDTTCMVTKGMHREQSELGTGKSVEPTVLQRVMNENLSLSVKDRTNYYLPCSYMCQQMGMQCARRSDD